MEAALVDQDKDEEEAGHLADRVMQTQPVYTGRIKRACPAAGGKVFPLTAMRIERTRSKLMHAPVIAT